MTEQLFQFLWQFQYFNKDSLQTTAGEAVQIIHTGTLNTNQGPDFINAKIKIGNTIWAGTIELHLKTSHWNKHKHDIDHNYKNVILHVVYEHDDENNPIPTLELQTRISHSLMKRYEMLMSSKAFIPCEKMIDTVSAITVSAWKDRLIAERLTRKNEIIFTYLQENNHHWEKSFWWLLAKNVGSKVNGESFENIAKSISLNILAKHKNSIHQMEALLLGQAGLLNEIFTEAYPVMLQKEYHFLKTKYKLQPPKTSVYFLRMRPENFPTIRLAQLAALIHHSVHLFSKIVEEPDVNKIKNWFVVEPNDFWNNHYTFSGASAYKLKRIGASMIENILINTVIPTLFAYGNFHQNQLLKDRALNWLTQIKSEKNNITKGFETIGFENKNAFDSQSLIECKTQYCSLKNCLKCAIGNSLIR
jgi:hypothetical protein